MYFLFGIIVYSAKFFAIHSEELDILSFASPRSAIEAS